MRRECTLGGHFRIPLSWPAGRLGCFVYGIVTSMATVMYVRAWVGRFTFTSDRPERNVQTLAIYGYVVLI